MMLPEIGQEGQDKLQAAKVYAMRNASPDFPSPGNPSMAMQALACCLVASLHSTLANVGFGILSPFFYIIYIIIYNGGLFDVTLN